MSNTHTYLAIDSCGCAVAIHSERSPYPQHQKSFEKQLGQWMAESVRDGLTIQRMPKDEALALFTANCPHGAKEESEIAVPMLFEMGAK